MSLSCPGICGTGGVLEEIAGDVALVVNTDDPERAVCGMGAGISALLGSRAA
ncbi:MAG: hypothetical protein OEZ06_17395 [Myxococcales bacterium]|nr:hypothetical protein [Myxococcales bacterium]